MRPTPSLLTLLLPLHLLRAPLSLVSARTHTHTHAYTQATRLVAPPLQYPVCARRQGFSSSCVALRHIDTGLDTSLVEGVDTMAEQADQKVFDGCEAGGKETAAVAGKEAKKEEKKEDALPPLSAADYKVYNQMSEHMDYYVR